VRVPEIALDGHILPIGGAAADAHRRGQHVGGGFACRGLAGEDSQHRVGPADFEGWVQERGLYFANPWDPRYETPLATHDPGETDKAGGLLFARVGKGVFVYTGYAFFRQLPAGVPGAYRLFANLLGLKGSR